MSTSSMRRGGLRAAGVACATLIFSLPALAGEIYSWRTEDGGYAFTDDPKAVPPRYQSQVETRGQEGLGGYARLTAPEPGSTGAYAKRLADRLSHLRALNRDLDAAHAARPAPPGIESLAVQTGDLNIGVPIDRGSDGPVVIERVRYIPEGEMATRHNLVVRKGDETLAVIKGKPLVTQIDQAPDTGERDGER